MYPMFLKPVIKDYIWGGNRLAPEFNVEGGANTERESSSSERQKTIAEAWLLSCHWAGASVVLNGVYKDQTLTDIIYGQGNKMVGEKQNLARFFPVLIKLIDAEKSLSIQVHPNDSYAMAKAKSFGKTEIWYVLDAKPESFLYCGFKTDISQATLAKALEEGTITEYLNQIPVKKGDLFFIEAGTVHAIGAGILLLEVQQNSDLTYRLYDYNRVDQEGKTRQLHYQEALDTVNRKAMPPVCGGEILLDTVECKKSLLTCCDYFTSWHYEVRQKVDLEINSQSFLSLVVIQGQGELIDISGGSGQTWELKKGDSIFFPAGLGTYRVQGALECIITSCE